MTENERKGKEKEAKMPVSRLRELLDYNPDTGELIRKIRTACRMKVGDVAGGLQLTGYIEVHIEGFRFLAHRVAFAIYYGRWPEGQIDHINGDRADNRIANLREVTRQENLRNSSIKSNNTSGFTGVHWYKATGRWHVKIYDNGKQIHIGFFDTIEEAVAARKEANILYGYSPSHGKKKTQDQA